MGKVQFVSHSIKEDMKDRSMKLLNKIKHTLQPNRLYIFSDEKHFSWDQIVNNQNNKLFWCVTNDVSQVVVKHQTSKNMVFGLFCSNGNVMLPFILPHIRLGGWRQVPAGGSVTLGQRSGYRKKLCLAAGLRAMSHKQENLVVSVRQFRRPHPA